MAQYIKGKQIAPQTVTLSGNTGNVIITGTVDTNSNFIIGNYIPTDDTHLVNKEYVDAISQGLQPHEPVVVVSTSNITRSGLLTIDGYTLVAGDRVLVVGQTDKTQNGIFVASATSWVRADDADGNPNNEISVGDFVYVYSGNTLSSSGWVLAKTDATNKYAIEPDIETQEWFQISSPGSYTADGEGLELLANEFYIELDGTTLTKSASGLKLSDTLSTAITTNTTNISTVSSELSVEISERESADDSLETIIGTLSGGVSTEASIRASVDSTLSTTISSESSIRSSADTSLENAIFELSGATLDIETILGENQFLTLIGGELTGTTNLQPSLSTAISTEASTRTSADTSLETEISEESSIRASVDSALSAIISSSGGFDPSSLETEISEESSIRASVDSTLSTAISSEAITRSTDDSSLSTAVSGEISNRSSADTSLQSAINAIDTTTGLSAESSIRASVDSTLSTGLSQRVSADTSLSTAVVNANSVRASVDSTLSTAISTEASTRTSADTSLQSAINAIDTTTGLSAESSIRASVDSTLSTTISTGLSQRVSADTSLSTAIVNANSVRASVDSTLSTAISTEASTRTSADTSLASEISEEASIRASADTSLAQQISSLTTPLVYEQVLNPSASGNTNNVLVSSTAFNPVDGILQEDSVFVFLNGVKYTFAISATPTTTVFYANILDESSGTSLYFDGTVAGFSIETNDEIILKWTVEG